MKLLTGAPTQYVPHNDPQRVWEMLVEGDVRKWLMITRVSTTKAEQLMGLKARSALVVTGVDIKPNTKGVMGK